MAIKCWQLQLLLKARSIVVALWTLHPIPLSCPFFFNLFFFSTPSYCYLSQPKLSIFQLSLSLDLNSLSFLTFFLVLFLPLSQHLATTWSSTHTLLSQPTCYCLFWEVDSPLFFNLLSRDPPSFLNNYLFIPFFLNLDTNNRPFSKLNIAQVVSPFSELHALRPCVNTIIGVVSKLHALSSTIVHVLLFQLLLQTFFSFSNTNITLTWWMEFILTDVYP